MDSESEALYEAIWGCAGLTILLVALLGVVFPVLYVVGRTAWGMILGGGFCW